MNSPSPSELKKLVNQKYSQIARSSSDCCGPESCCDSGELFSIMDESYDSLDGYHSDADLHLGCGIPVEHAGLKKGDHVLDLGCGAGNDLFVAHASIGDSGFLTGLDFSEEMLKKAKINQAKTGIPNMEFIHGDIEQMPLPDNKYDVILSNCVLNLVPDKQAAYSEIYRVLKTGGHFTISDVVVDGELPQAVQRSAELYAGCIAGAMERTEYLKIIEAAGFQNIQVLQQRNISIPGEWLIKNLGSAFSMKEASIQSITVSAYK